MSNYKSGDYVRYGMDLAVDLNHCDQLSKKSQWAMMCSMAMKMKEIKSQHFENAEKFLSTL